MVRLSDQHPLSSVGDVLLAARVVGRDAWVSNEGSMAQQNISLLSQDVQALFDTLRKQTISFVLVGGVALLRYVEGRNTQDIDLLLSPKAVKSIPDLTIIQDDRPVMRAQFRSVPVDVLLTTDPVFKLVSKKYASVQKFQDVSVNCATIEGLLLLKLYALPSLYRQGFMQRAALYENDILMLLQSRSCDMQAILSELEPFVEAGANFELRRIVEEIEVRLARMQRSRDSQN